MDILVIGLVWPEPSSSAAGWRMLQLLSLLKKLPNARISFACAAAKSEFSYPLASIGIQEEIIVLNDASFDAFVQQLQPGIVMYDRFVIEEQFGWRVHEQCPNAFTILDTEDLHCLRYAREVAAKKHTELNLFNELTTREIAAILRCDWSIMISQVEIDLLIAQFHIQRDSLVYLPFLEQVLTEEDIAAWKPFEARQDLVFIGNFLHEPNYQTVLYLKQKIWPLLRQKLPNVSLHIYGAYAHHKAMQLHNPKERFFIKGRCEHARATIGQYRLLVAPITFGAGAKGKFIDAMMSGTPSITTSVGAESMSGHLPWAGAIVENDEAFIEQVCSFYYSNKKWNDAQKNGKTIINELYDAGLYEAQFLEQLQSILEDIKGFRQQHFIRHILHTNAFQSKKYMSLWIEAKNK